MSTNSFLKIVFADKNSLVLRDLTQIFKQDERFDVRATGGDLFLMLLHLASIDVGIIGWKMPYADGRQVLSTLQERESELRVVFYSGADLVR